MLNQLRDLDLQLLRLFVTVVESGGFSAAQGELGVGQSTISTQMAKLETRLGFRLASHRGHTASEAQKAFAEDLLHGFGE